jgi:hypothetical protein
LGNNIDKAGISEPSDRLAHRGPAHAEVSGELYLAQRLSGEEAQAANRLDQLSEDPV